MVHTIMLLVSTLALSGQVWTYEYLNDLPLVIPKGNFMIHATLTDLNNGRKFFIQEFIHSNDYTRGKISLSSESSQSLDVYYGSSLKNQRLVVQDYDCNLYTYQNGWDQRIPGITKSLANQILLVGPSLIYRLNHKSLVWINIEDAEIRGTTMKAAYAVLESNKLKITCYYKDTPNLDYEVSQPARIEFIGSDPSDYRESIKQRLILDIYLITQTNEELDQIVNPTPGLGCPIRFSGEKDYQTNLFKISQDSVHYISIENVNGPTKSTTINEVYASEANQILHLKTRNHEITTEAVYDFTLGIIYIFQSKQGCLVYPMGLNDPGLEMRKSATFKVSKLLDVDTSYKYGGKTWFENRPGFKVDFWSSIDYNGTTSSGSYDKVVKVLFAVQSANTDKSSNLVPVGKTIYAYNKDHLGSYKLIETIKIDYYEFGQEISNEEYEEKFQVNDCYPDPSERKTLSIQFNCKEISGPCIDTVKKYPHTFRDQLRKSIVNSGVIAGSRIGEIDFVFGFDIVTAYVTFLTYPDVTRAFRSSYLYLSGDTFKNVHLSTTNGAGDCLKQSLALDPIYEAIVYCGKAKTCSHFYHSDDLVVDEQNGIGCTVYYTPLRNLYRYGQQSSLDGIQTILKSKGLAFSVYINHLMFYVITQIEEVKERETKSRQLYTIERNSSKLNAEDTETVMTVPVTNLADCYRACANLENDDCESFSYCQKSDSEECLLSTSIYINVSDKLVNDTNCRVYRKNSIDDYISVNNREFINQISVASQFWLDDCADLCSESGECFSFQYCDGYCTFGGYYTDTLTKFSKNCNIYIPKLAHKFAPTGRKLVTEIYHVELGLTLDQCAALCYDMGSNEDCVSYNYCPKGRNASSCNLSKYSVKDSSKKVTVSDICTNYERKPDNEPRKKEKANKQESNGTSGSAAFGIVTLFVAVGICAGVIGSFAYHKAIGFIARSPEFDDETSDWNRHFNDGEQQSDV